MAAYIGEGEKLWILRDLDGDGRADVKEVVFSGFGTGDVHQNINSFTWTPDGALMFSQGLHNYSNVTTPWGGRRLYGAGFWMYRPLRAQLTPYPTGFPANAWGTVYDDAGQPFSVAGAAGMFWTTPLLVSTEHLIERQALPNSGQIVKQGMLKYCGVDIPRNAHWPADMHAELVSGGFFENCIYRHKLGQDKENPSGYEAVRQPNLITSSSVAFRPVDVKFGPDGALYISDWYNPIIGHYQASFRHPDRDKMHGRIWRVVKKGAPLVKMRALDKMDVGKLLDILGRTTLLSSGGANPTTRVSSFLGDRWEQYQAQRLLMSFDGNLVSTAAKGFTPFNPGRPMTAEEMRLYDSIRFKCLLQARQWFDLSATPSGQTFDVFANLGVNLPKSEYRCLAARTIGLWQDRLKDPLGLLEKSIADEDPRVRLEAIAACSHIPKPESIAIALRALDRNTAVPAVGVTGVSPVTPASRAGETPPTPTGATPVLPAAAPAGPPYFDSFHDRTLELAVHALAPYWEPALREGKLTLPPKHLAWLLDKKGDGDTLAAVRAMLKGSVGVSPAQEKPNTSTGETPALPSESRRALLLMLAKRGGSEDVAAALDAGARDAALLSELADLVEAQQIKAPANADAVLGTERGLQSAANGSVEAGERGLKSALRSSTARLAGLWKLTALTPQLKAQLTTASTPPESQRVILVALARLNAEHDLILKLSADAQQPYAVRLGAIEALTINDGTNAAKAALALMPLAKTEEDMRALLAPFLVKAGRAKLLVTAITETPCSKEAADLATRALIAMGRNEPELSASLNKILGRTGVVMPFDSQWVSSLGNEATVAGNAKRGDEIFHRPALNCIACHQIKNQGGIIGPQLDAVGRGVPIELLVEAVMWPQRQIKEGYVATNVVMKDGRSLVGYKNKESADELTIRDMATNALTALQKNQMRTRTDAGSLMPDGLTASLSREELRDLIAYLASLGKAAK